MAIVLVGTGCAADAPPATQESKPRASPTASDPDPTTAATRSAGTGRETGAGRATTESRPSQTSTSPIPPSVPATPVAPALPPPTGPSAPNTAAPHPVSLTVDSIGLSESLITLGLTDQGTAEVPTDYARAGWFSGGGRPGTIGPTVILGHVDSTTGPAVFFRLRELQTGDTVRLGMADGTVATYRISAVDTYPKDDFPTFAVYGATPRDIVRLVTCGGEFDRDAGSYLANVVVTAERVD